MLDLGIIEIDVFDFTFLIKASSDNIRLYQIPDTTKYILIGKVLQSFAVRFPPHIKALGLQPCDRQIRIGNHADYLSDLLRPKVPFLLDNFLRYSRFGLAVQTS